MIRLASLLLLALVLLTGTAEARPRVSVAHGCVEVEAARPCMGPWASFASEPHQRPGIRGYRASYGRAEAAQYGRGSVVAHPSGCPGRAFCGCGAAVRVFGTPRRDLWLAANWLRFPRAAPAPGMVAARRGHVFVLEQHLGGNTWLAYDANSGGRATRIHPRSIAGYAIVNPRA